MSNDKSMRPSSPALPETVADLMAHRRSLRSRSLNDDVEEIHLKLWVDPSYHKLFDPIWREDTVEGSFIADDMVAAMQVRTYARKNDLPIASQSKLHAIVHSLHVVCRRYGIDRRTRQGLVGGEPVDRADSFDAAAE